MPSSYDVIVIGAGPAGENLAGKTQAAGFKTVIIEQELAGGECSYWACMPSKAMLRPQALLNAARRVPGAKEVTGAHVDVKALLDARYEIVSKYDDKGQIDWIESVHVDVIRGTARFTGDKAISVNLKDGGTETLTANVAVVVATGSVPVLPPIDGLADVKAWTNREATSATEVPRRLAVIGGGYVAAEMAQAWKSIGTEHVTMLVRGKGLLENAEPFASEAVSKAFTDEGIKIHFNTEVTKASKSGNTITLTLNDGSKLDVDDVLVATGRKPTTGDLGIETIGLEPGKAIEVDDTLRSTKLDWLYAIGDVNGRAPLTHMGKYQARIAGDVIAGKKASAWADNKAVPSVVFTDPQVAHVGMTLKEAKDAGINVRELRVPLSSASGAFINKEDGDVQLVVDESKSTIVGATFVGPEVGEMLHAATIAIVAEVPLQTLWHAIPSYPTVSEVWLRLLESYGL